MSDLVMSPQELAQIAREVKAEFEQRERYAPRKALSFDLPVGALVKVGRLHLWHAGNGRFICDDEPVIQGIVIEGGPAYQAWPTDLPLAPCEALPPAGLIRMFAVGEVRAPGVSRLEYLDSIRGRVPQVFAVGELSGRRLDLGIPCRG